MRARPCSDTMEDGTGMSSDKSGILCTMEAQQFQFPS